MIKQLSTYLILAFALLLTVSSCFSDGNPNDDPDIQKYIGESVDEVIDLDSISSLPGFDAGYENTDRLAWQKPDKLIELFGNLSNKTVADIGTGDGFFALKLAEKAQKVLAIDIDETSIAALKNRIIKELTEDKQSKIETRLVSPNDPKLKPNELDAAIISNTYMYIQNRTQYLSILKKGMKPGSQLMIIDFKKKEIPFGPPQLIRVPLYQVEKELRAAGFSKVTSMDMVLDYQYVVIAQP